jgi:hypothetical protein
MVNLRKMKRYKHFWKNFNSNDFFISQILSELITENPIEVHSVYRPYLLRLVNSRFSGSRAWVLWKKLMHLGQKKNVKRIWWTGENIRPPVGESFDSFISFDQDPMGGANVFFPLFYAELFFTSSPSRNRHGVGYFVPKNLMTVRNSSANTSDKKFACIFLNNPEPTRLRAIEALSKYGMVDVYGKYSGRQVSDKFSIAKKYKYMICFENDLYPGYITEKLLDAYLCETVPLYWGLLGNEKHINRKSFVNAADFDSLDEFAFYVSQMTDLDYAEIYQQPLMTSIPDLAPLRQALLGE